MTPDEPPRKNAPPPPPYRPDPGPKVPSLVHRIAVFIVGGILVAFLVYGTCTAVFLIR